MTDFTITGMVLIDGTATIYWNFCTSYYVVLRHVGPEDMDALRCSRYGEDSRWLPRVKYGRV